jgi:hypothetical protein
MTAIGYAPPSVERQAGRKIHTDGRRAGRGNLAAARFAVTGVAEARAPP